MYWPVSLSFKAQSIFDRILVDYNLLIQNHCIQYEAVKILLVTSTSQDIRKSRELFFLPISGPNLTI